MRIFSGIRPSGQIHIGNYLGAIKQWLELQNKNDGIFCIVDLHAITTPYRPEDMQKEIKKVLIIYLTAGLDPKKSIIFVQSHIKEHTELAWLLSVVTPVGLLRRMTQFKEKSRQYPMAVNAGLLNYPVLMAADILLYKSEGVPVGRDQAQHVELVRDIARYFNRRFGETFKEPKTILSKQGKNIMSLTEPEKKMSKSAASQSCIYLFDSPSEIHSKIMGAKTDTGKEIIYNPQEKPGISNLLAIYSLFPGRTVNEIEKKFRRKGYREFKSSLASLITENLKPFREKRVRFLENGDYLDKVLKDGQKKAIRIAKKTIREVKEKMGLI